MKKLTEEETNKFFKLLQEACALAEWDIAFDSEADHVQGMIIGNYEYINTVVNSLEQNAEDFDVYNVLKKPKKDEIH